MKLEIPKNNKAKTSPDTNKGRKPSKREKVNGLYLFNPLTYEYEFNEEVILNEAGLKQITTLLLPFYRVVNIRQAPLGDMVVNLFELDESMDKNIKNPYLAHHFEPKNPKKI